MAVCIYKIYLAPSTLGGRDVLTGVTINTIMPIRIKKLDRYDYYSVNIYSLSPYGQWRARS